MHDHKVCSDSDLDCYQIECNRLASNTLPPAEWIDHTSTRNTASSFAILAFELSGEAWLVGSLRMDAI